MRHYGVTALGKGTTIPCVLCLVLVHWGGSESHQYYVDGPLKPVNTMQISA